MSTLYVNQPMPIFVRLPDGSILIEVTPEGKIYVQGELVKEDPRIPKMLQEHYAQTKQQLLKQKEANKNYPRAKYTPLQEYNRLMRLWDSLGEKMKNSEEYIEDVLRTESKVTLSQDSHLSRGLHAVLGIATESGELLDAYKKHIYYGKSLDCVNVEEELGDLCWYMSVLIDVLRAKGMNVSWEKIWAKNAEKLKKRYGEKFSQEKALNRDLDAERKILEE